MLAVGHLERVRRFGRRADDEPELIGVGVVEELTHRVGVNMDCGERIDGEHVLIDAHAAGAFEQDVELVLICVAVAGGGLPGLQPPHPSGEGGRLKLLRQVGVGDAHLIGRAPVGVDGRQDAVAHFGLFSLSSRALRRR